MGKKRAQYNTLDSIGVAYLKLQSYAEARKYLLEALELHAYVGDRWGLAMALMHLSQAGDGQPTSIWSRHAGGRSASHRWKAC